jgi:hypothetical protein
VLRERAETAPSAAKRALNETERPAQSPRRRRLCAEKAPPPAGSSWQGRRGDRAASAEGQDVPQAAGRNPMAAAVRKSEPPGSRGAWVDGPNADGK